MSETVTNCEGCVFDLGRGECFHHRVVRACAAAPCGSWKRHPAAFGAAAETPNERLRTAG